jgi:hypothetical protein
MKINAVAKLLKENGGLTLLDGNARQHVCIGQALYPLDGMPQMNEETILAVLDIPAGDRPDYHILRAPVDSLIDFLEDNADSDQDAELIDLLVSVNGTTLRPLYTPYGMVCIREAERRPVSDSAKTATYHARMVSGKPVVVIKNGFQLIAAIVPVTNWAEQKTVEWLHDLSAYAGRLHNEAQADGEEDENA